MLGTREDQAFVCSFPAKISIEKMKQKNREFSKNNGVHLNASFRKVSPSHVERF
jgi:hypothetical protein